jgi:hypothetical protein
VCGREEVVLARTARRVVLSSWCGQRSRSAVMGVVDWVYAVGSSQGAPISEESRHPSGAALGAVVQGVAE